MQHVACVECGGNVPLPSNAVVGELIQCPDCGAELELTKLSPPEVELAPQVQEDWGE
jgi:alpha-aminoadipate carrier protein LysW